MGLPAGKVERENGANCEVELADWVAGANSTAADVVGGLRFDTLSMYADLSLARETMGGRVPLGIALAGWNPDPLEFVNRYGGGNCHLLGMTLLDRLGRDHGVTRMALHGTELVLYEHVNGPAYPLGHALTEFSDPVVGQTWAADVAFSIPGVVALPSVPGVVGEFVGAEKTLQVSLEDGAGIGIKIVRPGKGDKVIVWNGVMDQAQAMDVVRRLMTFRQTVKIDRHDREGRRVGRVAYSFITGRWRTEMAGGGTRAYGWDMVDWRIPEVLAYMAEAVDLPPADLEMRCARVEAMTPEVLDIMMPEVRQLPPLF